MAHSPDAIRNWTGPRRIGRHHPLAGPAVLAEPAIIRLAFLGRTSTYDLQDPTLSLPRQLQNCQAALPENAAIRAYFYDIESGRKDASVRSASRSHEMFDIPIPRDGGVQELLDEAARPDRRFDVVICEDISRVARRTYIATQIEHQLEQLGIPLVAVDEGVRLGGSGRRTKTATQVLTRRVKQGVAEWYVTEMLEKSWDGFEQHTEQGYNVGKPSYGFRAEHVRHPVPAKRAKGIKKTRLVVHEVEGPVVRKMFGWRVSEHLGYQTIADRLNQDLVTNPPPTPVDPARAVGMWTYSNVREVLTNPKHTGHMVWNRRARKGNGHNRINPPSEWVWSRERVHEQLVDLETFVQTQEVGQRRERSRTAPGKRNDGQAKRVYRLRSYIFCELCGRRLFGNALRDISYYICRPKKAWRPQGHPTILRVREDTLLNALEEFLSTRVFGTYRHHLLDANLKTLTENADRDHTERVTALRRAIADTHTKSKNLLRTLEVAEQVDEDMIRDINERRAELKAERADLEARLAEAEDEVQRAPNPDLLHRLPIGRIDLDALPDELSRRLFEALRLEIRYQPDTRTATCRVTLVGTTIDTLARAATASNVVSSRNQKVTTKSEENHTMSTSRVAPAVDGLCGAPGAACTAFTPGAGGAEDAGDLVFRLRLPIDMERRTGSAGRSQQET